MKSIKNKRAVLGLLFVLLITDFNYMSLLAQQKPENLRQTGKQKNKKRNLSASNAEELAGNCNYKGHKLYRGSRGGCYYYSGKSKQYVDRNYCAGCK